MKSTIQQLVNSLDITSKSHEHDDKLDDILQLHADKFDQRDAYYRIRTTTFKPSSTDVPYRLSFSFLAAYDSEDLLRNYPPQLPMRHVANHLLECHSLKKYAPVWCGLDFDVDYGLSKSYVLMQESAPALEVLTEICSAMQIDINNGAKMVISPVLLLGNVEFITFNHRFHSFSLYSVCNEEQSITEMTSGLTQLITSAFGGGGDDNCHSTRVQTVISDIVMGTSQAPYLLSITFVPNENGSLTIERCCFYASNFVPGKNSLLNYETLFRLTSFMNHHRGESGYKTVTGWSIKCQVEHKSLDLDTKFEVGWGLAQVIESDNKNNGEM